MKRQRSEEQGGDGNNPQKAQMVLSSSSSSSSPPVTTTVPQTPGRTMEEVWKDIAQTTTLPTLDNSSYRSYHHHQAVTAGATTCHRSIADTDLPHLRGMILQDFLGRPFNETNAPASAQPAEERSGGHEAAAGLPSFRLAPTPGRPSPATLLTLTSGADSQRTVGFPPATRPPGYPAAGSPSYGQNRGPSGQHQSSVSSITAAAFSETLGSPCPAIFPFCCNQKRVPEQPPQPENSDGDRRNKRIIKNRESAARSRARKQAYTNELELEVNQLMEENEKLRTLYEELRAKMAAQVSTEKTLQRCSTAPF